MYDKSKVKGAKELIKNYISSKIFQDESVLSIQAHSS